LLPGHGITAISFELQVCAQAVECGVIQGSRRELPIEGEFMSKRSSLVLLIVIALLCNNVWAVEVGETAPSFKEIDIGGHLSSSGDYRGSKYLVVVFFIGFT
jgi:hypothetical protein